MSRKIVKMNAEARERLEAIEYYQAGHSQRETAKKFNVHFTTVGEWLKMYNEGGPAALKVPRKPRQEYNLDPEKIKAAMKTADEKYLPRLRALLDLSRKGARLDKTAKKHGVTPQALMKWRRAWVAGKWLIAE